MFSQGSCKGKPETFDFLGFTHFCTRSHKWGSFVIGRKTVKKRMRAKLKAIKMELLSATHKMASGQHRKSTTMFRRRGSEEGDAAAVGGPPCEGSAAVLLSDPECGESWSCRHHAVPAVLSRCLRANSMYHSRQPGLAIASRLITLSTG